MISWQLYLRYPLIIPLIIFAISAYVFLNGFTYPGSAGQFPIVISAITMILTVWELALNLSKVHSANRGLQQDEHAETSDRDPISLKILFMTIGMFFYFLIMSLLGFMISTFLYIIFASRYLGMKKWWLSLLISVGTILLLYLTFSVLFGITLPEGILFE